MQILSYQSITDVKISYYSLAVPFTDMLDKRVVIDVMRRIVNLGLIWSESLMPLCG